MMKFNLTIELDASKVGEEFDQAIDETNKLWGDACADASRAQDMSVSIRVERAEGDTVKLSLRGEGSLSKARSVIVEMAYKAEVLGAAMAGAAP